MLLLTILTSVFLSLSVYVSPSGLDVPNCGSSFENACQTVTFALKHGTQASLISGTYVEYSGIDLSQSANISGSGFSDCKLTVRPSFGGTLFILHNDVTLRATQMTFIFVAGNTNTFFSASYPNSSLSLRDCYFTNDELIPGSGTPFQFLHGDSALLLNNCTFKGIQTSLYLFYMNDIGNVTCSSSHFSDCVATTNAMFYIRILEKSFIMSSCDFTNCTNSGSGAICWCKSYDIHKPTFNITDSVFSLCVSLYSNGGAFYIDEYLQSNFCRCTFTKCSAAENGGALFVFDVNVTIDDCTFTQCSAAFGSAIYIYGSFSKSYTIDGCRFSQNKFGSEGNTRGRDVYDDVSSLAEITRSIIGSCTDSQSDSLYFTEYDNVNPHFEIGRCGGGGGGKTGLPTWGLVLIIVLPSVFFVIVLTCILSCCSIYCCGCCCCHDTYYW